MREKHRLLLKMRSLEFEIKELIYHCKECDDCFELLKEKLNCICSFIINENNEKQWGEWGAHDEILYNAQNLRDISCKALCDLEKYQAMCIKNNLQDNFNYTKELADTVKEEVIRFNIDKNSKILFIGSGAMPISAFTIAKEVGAQIMCIDIDNEAIDLSKQVAKIVGVDRMVKFSNNCIDEISYVKEATHIIIASLVENKLEIIESLRKLIKDNAKIILRYGNGLKSIFNYPLDIKCINDWRKTPMNYRKNIYETLVLEK